MHIFNVLNDATFWAAVGSCATAVALFIMVLQYESMNRNLRLSYDIEAGKRIVWFGAQFFDYYGDVWKLSQIIPECDLKTWYNAYANQSELESAYNHVLTRALRARYYLTRIIPLLKTAGAPGKKR